MFCDIHFNAFRMGYVVMIIEMNSYCFNLDVAMLLRKDVYH